MQLDAIAEDLDYRPHSMSFDLYIATRGIIARSPIRAKAVASTIKRQSSIQGTSLFSQSPPAQRNLDFLRKPSVRTRVSASRPMSMHQAIVMRSIYRQPSVRSRSDTGSTLLEKRQTLSFSISEESTPSRKRLEQVSMKNILKTLWPCLDLKS
jgi:hypothetical protein